jgi:Kef-type K+ transport system membrane component KefB
MDGAAFHLRCVLVRGRDASCGAELLRTDISRSLERICSVPLLPVFFVVAGLQVNLSQVGAGGLGEFALIMLIAVGGKFTARSWRLVCTGPSLGSCWIQRCIH